MNKVQLLSGQEKGIELVESWVDSPEGELTSAIETFAAKEKVTDGVLKEIYHTSFFDRDTGEYDIVAIQVTAKPADNINVRTVRKTFCAKNGKWVEPERSVLIDFDC